MSEQKYIPAINTSGYFDLLPPFDQQVATNERFTLKSVRTISEYLANNENVRETVYIQNGIDALYQDHLKVDIEILGIQSDRGAWVYVPISHVKCYPTVNGIAYRTVSIVLPLQAIPVNTDLSALLSQLSQIVTGNLGFPVTAVVVETSKVILVSSEAHENLQLTRALNKSEATDASVVNELNRQLNVAINKVQALEDYVVTHPH